MRKSLELLDTCRGTLENRQKAYLSYGEERRRVAEMVNTLHGTKITPQMVTDIFIFTKMVRRVRRDAIDKDDYIDHVGYVAKGYEADSEGVD